MMMNIIGRQLVAIRLAKRLTQDILSIRLQLLGWSQCDRFTISKIELGTRKVSDRELLWLSEVLDVPADALLGRKD